ncbi:SDR family oxidoreductase [Thermanaerothrix sp.]|jgi:NAD(P)-dependent dehydrogenase (short-subunit alcohol dehydrogenase family)|uniref:SDR family oxidoreductase n=1 Tax=Thermanaerothrix sp. TaxID=2972675 RepID=UPI002ADE6FE8|nr:SDR family oxidoreductase [Thermanaerothrix sp.]
MRLLGKTFLVTGAARRLGRVFALAIAKEGGNVVIHHGHSPAEANEVAELARNLGVKAWVIEGDLSNPTTAESLLNQAWELAPLDGLVNNAAIFENRDLWQTDLETWQRHLNINLTAPFLLSRHFAALLPASQSGRIINILDWRALRPGSDHLAYMISKAALAALTRSLALALAPRIVVNGIALGAILPPSDGNVKDDLLTSIPARRWASIEEVEQTLIFLLDAPMYITGEIIHLDGGRHLV